MILNTLFHLKTKLNYLSFGGLVSNTASSMLNVLKLSSSFGKLFSSQAGVKRTGTCSEATLVNELCFGCTIKLKKR